MMYDIRPDGQPILTSYFVSQPVSALVQKNENNITEGSGLKAKKNNSFTNFKISSNPESKQKINKFINLKL